jgi:hypothetical protein
MRKGYILLIFTTGLLVFAGCKKEKTSKADCERLQNAIGSGNKDEVKEVINKFIGSLPSQNYTEQNLNNLLNAIGQQCGTSAVSICFDCIDTFPSQSEIKISYFSINGPVERIIDISYNAGNKMIFRNMHD